MGNFIEIAQYPQWDSVSEYTKYLKRNSPNIQIERDIRDPDIKCTCCGQEAPSEAAALIKTEDKTPFSVRVNSMNIQTLWICSDCFNHGVRPKYVKFGDIKWNKEGRRIKSRAEDNRGHPW